MALQAWPVAGQTEMAKTIFGYYPLEEGEFFFHAKPLKVKSPENADEEENGYVGESRKQKNSRC
ncbi:MAG: hypothetical protein V8R80_00010 [Eubacterium sp.]